MRGEYTLVLLEPVILQLNKSPLLNHTLLHFMIPFSYCPISVFSFTARDVYICCADFLRLPWPVSCQSQWPLQCLHLTDLSPAFHIGWLWSLIYYLPILCVVLPTYLCPSPRSKIWNVPGLCSGYFIQFRGFKNHLYAEEYSILISNAEFFPLDSCNFIPLCDIW